MKFFGEHRVGPNSPARPLQRPHPAQRDSPPRHPVPQALRQVHLMLLGGGVAIIFAISPRLSLVMVSTFPVLMLVAVFLGRKVRAHLA